MYKNQKNTKIFFHFVTFYIVRNSEGRGDKSEHLNYVLFLYNSFYKKETRFKL